MKRILLVLSFLFSLCAEASEPYFCNRQGVQLQYERTTVGDGSLVWRHVMTIDLVGADGVIDYNSLFTKPSGAKMYGGPVALHVIVRDDGDVEMNVAEAVGSVFSNVVGAKHLTTTGGQTVLPADMQPGDILPDAGGTASVKVASIAVTVTDRKVLSRESLTTPAGTFDCIVVQEHKVEKGTLRNRITTARTWYARGIGMVRHDTYDRNLKLETSEVLVKIVQ